LGIWSFSGAWCLDFGASLHPRLPHLYPTHSLLHPKTIVQSHRRATFTKDGQTPTGYARSRIEIKNATMKTSTKLALLGLFTAGVAAWTLTAQDAGNPPPNQERPPRNQDGPPPGGPDRAGGGQRPVMMPLISALDANHDGVIDADEIKNASAALMA